MTIERKQLYAGLDGDRWYLARDIADGRVFVQHRANAASGGQIKEIEIGAFLKGVLAPEHRELLRLIGTLVAGLEVPEAPHE